MSMIATVVTDPDLPADTTDQLHRALVRRGHIHTAAISVAATGVIGTVLLLLTAAPWSVTIPVALTAPLVGLLAAVVSKDIPAQVRPVRNADEQDTWAHVRANRTFGGHLHRALWDQLTTPTN